MSEVGLANPICRAFLWLAQSQPQNKEELRLNADLPSPSPVLFLVF